MFNDATGPHVPDAGWSVKVIYDPGDHSRVVIDLIKLCVQPGVADRDAAAARQEQALAMARDPEARAERIEQMRAAGTAGAGAHDLLALQQRLAAEFLQRGGADAGQSGTPRGPDIADQLSKLADLRDRGVLTEAEFQQQKTRLLGSA